MASTKVISYSPKQLTKTGEIYIMTITTNTPGQKQYTLICTDNTTKQSYICTYGESGAILTTDYDALIVYTSGLVLHFGLGRTYTICSVTPVLNAIDPISNI